MGAAPSRETIEHSLPQPPFYGQRQQIVLIPLLKKFFPSADCPLFAQLYEARCDPAVRYYHYADDGVEGISRTPQAISTPLRSITQPPKEGCKDDAYPFSLSEKVGNTPFHCPPIEVFPGVPFSRAAMYDAYVTNGGEKLVYDTDAAMLQAYRADSTSVRPMPCAVAFLYHKSAAKTAAAAMNNDAGEGADEGGTNGGAAAGAATSTAHVGFNHIPEDCSEVLGCFVKATGFVGDVQCLGRRHGGTDRDGKRADLNYEMQMFLTKSAGDHNRSHVLFSAVYTYAEQWQRACMHCVPHDLSGAHSLSKKATNDDSAATSNEALDDAAFFYRPFTLTHEMLVEASRAGGRNPLPSNGAKGGSTAENIPVGPLESAGSAASISAGGREHGSDHPHVKALHWAPPPLPAFLMRSRRANVPLLCFLREARACVANMFFFHLKHYYHEHPQEGVQDSEPTEEMVVAATAMGGNIGVRPTQHPDMLPPGCWHMWMQRTQTAVSETEEPNFEAALNVHCTAPFMQSIVEYIVACLLHNLNPLEAFHPQPSRIAAPNIRNSPSDSAARTDATGDPMSGEGLTTSVVKTSPHGNKEGTNGSDTRTNAETAAKTSMTTPTGILRFLSLFRLMNEDVLVDPWPPRPLDTTTALPSTGVTADILTQWKSLHSGHYLFWVVGPSVESRRSATVALLNWVQVKENPVIWGYDLDEHDCGIVSPLSETSKKSIGYAIYPSSSLEDYMCTVTLNGVEEEMIRGDTVLCLMPVTNGVSTTKRVLRVCHLPLEELLLGELRNASKLAREAGPDDPHWIRQNPSTQAPATHHGCILHAPDPDTAGGDSEAAAVLSNGVELPAVPPEADGIVGDGTSCLWRVELMANVYRVIAVTPQFLKPLRRKHPKKKRLPTKAVVAQGTATQVFLAGHKKNGAGTGDNEKEPPGDNIEVAEQQQHPVPETETVKASTTAAATPNDQASQPAVGSMEEENVKVAHETARTAAPAAPPTPVPMSKGKKKKTKKAAAAAQESNTETAVKATNNSAVINEATETLSLLEDKTELPTTTRHPEPHADVAAVVNASADQKAKKAAMQSDGSVITETLITATAKEASKPAPKLPSAVIPLRPIPTGEADPNVVPNSIKSSRTNGNSSKSWSELQQPVVASTKMTATATPAPYYSEKGGWGYGGTLTLAAACPPGYTCYGGRGGRLPSYDHYSCPPPPPPPPPPPWFYEYGGRQYVQPGYKNRYYPLEGYQVNYAPDFGYTRRYYYDPSYDQLQNEGMNIVGDSSNGGDRAARAPYDYEARVVTVMEQTRGEVVTFGATEGVEVKRMSSPERGERGESRVVQSGQQVAVSGSESASLTLQRHVSFRMETSRTAASSHTADVALAPPSSSSRAVRGPDSNVPIPLPLPETMISGPLPNSNHSVSRDTSNANSSAEYSPQHSPSVKDYNGASLSAGNSRPRLQLDDLGALATHNNGSVAAVPTSHHTRYTSSPYQQRISTFEDVGMASSPGAGPAGSSVNVRVRVRHHQHHAHSRSTSFFSDSTTDHGGNDNNHHSTQGEANASGMHPAHSFASMGSASIVFHGAGGAAGSIHAGSMRERANSGIGGDHSSHRQQVPGLASSTRSGETTSTARLTDKRSGTYRWDWRTAGLEMGEED